MFHTQMMLVGGSDVVRCKLFMSTLEGTTMDWFISLLDGHVTSFVQLSQLSSRAVAPPFCSVCEYLKRSEQRGALAAVCTPMIKSASEKHQRVTHLRIEHRHWML